MVEATLSYLRAMSEKPGYWLTKPPAGTSWRNTRGDRRVVEVQDAREVGPGPSLDLEGFALVPHRTRVSNLYDPAAVRAEYYPEVEAIARFTAYTAIDDPTSPENACPRESIEVRTLAFFAS